MKIIIIIIIPWYLHVSPAACCWAGVSYAHIRSEDTGHQCTLFYQLSGTCSEHVAPRHPGILQIFEEGRV